MRDIGDDSVRGNQTRPHTGHGRGRRAAVLVLAILAAAPAPAAHATDYAWRYYRVGNTGIQGDYCEALWVGPDGDPFIGGYDPFFEEGGFAKFVQAENRWVNYSNVDYPVIGHPDDTGTTRVRDIVPSGARSMSQTKSSMSAEFAGP